MDGERNTEPDKLDSYGTQEQGQTEKLAVARSLVGNTRVVDSLSTLAGLV